MLGIFLLKVFSLIPQILHMKPNPEPPPCWGGLLICIWPVAIIFSILVQCFITAWRVNHRRRPRSRRHAHRTTRSNSRPRETREEARQRKYRYLYQVRTARGDIISQVIPETCPNARRKPTNSIRILCYFARIMYRRCRNVFNQATDRHQNSQPKPIRTSGIR